jgi:hypothetical protein
MRDEKVSLANGERPYRLPVRPVEPDALVMVFSLPAPVDHKNSGFDSTVAGRLAGALGADCPQADRNLS